MKKKGFAGLAGLAAILPPSFEDRVKRDNLVNRNRSLAKEAGMPSSLEISAMPFAMQITALEAANADFEVAVVRIREERAAAAREAAEKAIAEKTAREAAERAAAEAREALAEDITLVVLELRGLAVENGEKCDLQANEVPMTAEALETLEAEKMRLLSELAPKRAVYIPRINEIETERDALAGELDIQLEDAPDAALADRVIWLEDNLKKMMRQARKAREAARLDEAREAARKALPADIEARIAAKLREALTRAEVKTEEKPPAPTINLTMRGNGGPKRGFAKNDPRGMVLSADPRVFAEQVGILNRLHEKAGLPSDIRIGKHRMPAIIKGDVTAEHRMAAENLRLALCAVIKRREEARVKKAEAEKKADAPKEAAAA